MPFKLTAAEYSQLKAAYAAAINPESALYNPSNRSAYAALYQKIIGYFSNDTLSVEETRTALWIKGALGVNQDNTAESDFIRDYNNAQSLLRYGTGVSDAQMNRISDEIAYKVTKDILGLYEANEPSHLPPISDIANADARPAATSLFQGDETPGGWAGNPLFLFLGHYDSFSNNILSPDGDTYDLLAMMKTGYDVLPDITGVPGDFLAFLGIETLVELGPLLFGAGYTAIEAEAKSAVLKALETSEKYLENAYGFGLIGAGSTVLFGDVLLGSTKNDILTGNNEYGAILGYDEIIHAGDGDDKIIGSAGQDIIDGGRGTDSLDFSISMNPFSVKSAEHEGLGSSLQIDDSSFLSKLSFSYAYNIENLKLGSGEDDVAISLDANASLEKLDTGAGDDDINIKLLTGHAFIELQAGAGDDTVKVRGVAKGFVPNIYLGDGNDTLKGATEGAIIHGDTGSDTFYIGRNYLIADADKNDSLSWYGLITLHGGVHMSTSESPWAWGAWGMRYAVDKASELVVRDWFGNETFVSKFNQDISGVNRTAGILLAEMEITTFRLRDLKGGAQIYSSFAAVMGTYLKALTGKSYFKGVDPLVLDLDGDGIELNALTDVVPRFDIDKDGFAEKTGWVRGDDGFLVRDLNANGKIDNLGEMFGTATTNGFAALKALDSNADGKISSLDTAFTSLRIWKDANGNMVTDAGELLTLGAAGIASINLTPTSTKVTTLAGNDLVATGTFTRTNGTTGTAASVDFNVNQRDTLWLGDKTIDAVAATLPEVKGYGTLTDLRIAMTDSATLKSAMQTALPKLNTTNLATLRTALTPVLTEWTKAVPVPVGTPGLAAHADVAIRAGTVTGTGAQVYDYAYKVTDASGSYYKLASGAAVKDTAGVVIARPTYANILAQTSTQGSWTTFSGAQLQFLERYLGTELPIGINNLSGASSVSAAGGLLSQLWNTLNEVAVRIASQGPLAPYFAGTKYNVTTDHFQATTDRQLVPMFEAILKAAPLSATGAETHLQSWKPILDVFLQNYDRGADYLKVSYAFLFQDLVAAYENVGLATTLVKAAAAFDIPTDLIKVGTGTLTGSGDADLFYLGAGDQIAKGAGGPDSYIVGKNFGHDVIDDYEGAMGDSPDTLRFAHVKPTDVTMQRVGTDLIIKVIGTTDELKIIGQFEGVRFAPIVGSLDPDHGIREIVFANGVVWDKLDIAQAVTTFTSGNDNITGTETIDFLDGGAGNDMLSGLGDGDVYRFGIGGGQDVVNDLMTYVYNDAPDFLDLKAGVTLDNITLARVGNSSDLIVKINGTTDQITIKGQFDATYTGPLGTQWFHRLEGIRFADGNALLWNEIMPKLVEQAKTAGNDTIYGFSAEDTLDGGVGDDYLSGGNENDTYIFGTGYGKDTIFEGQSNILSGNTDTVQFTNNLQLSDVVFTRTGRSNDMVIKLKNSSDQLTIVDQFEATYTGPFGTQWLDRIEYFNFSNGQSINANEAIKLLLQSAGTSGNDTIYGFSLEDTLDGGAGDDFLSGGNENDTYIFGLGYGHDTIEEGRDNILSGSTDTLQFLTGVLASEVKFSRIGNSNDLTITLKDGSTLTILQQFSITIGLGAYEFERIEQFKFVDGTVWTYNDVMQRFLDQAATAGNDTIYGFTREDILNGGAGDDYLDGGYEGDIYIYGRGFGNDVIHDAAYPLSAGSRNGLDELRLLGINPSDIKIERTVGTYDIIIRIVNTNETVTLRDQAYSYINGSNTEIENIVFANGTVWSALDLRAQYLVQAGTAGNDHILGFANNDILDGKAGNDTLEGWGNSDTYLFGKGYGQDTIIDFINYVTWDGPDTVQFGAGITVNNLIFSRSGQDLIVKISGTADQLTIKNHFDGNGYSNDSYAIENFKFADGSVLNQQDIASLVAKGLGTIGNDSIIGSGFNELLNGKQGNDTIRGGGGDDTYLHAQGDGQDYIAEWYGEGTDTLKLTGAAFTLANLKVAHPNAYDAVLSFTGVTDTITLQREFENNYGVEKIILNDGTVLGVAELRAKYLAQAATTGNDSILGFYGVNDTLSGGFGNDTMRGNSGDDTYLHAQGDGRDYIAEWSNEGTDTLKLTGAAFTLANLKVANPNASDAVLSFSGVTDTITLQREFENNYGVEKIILNDGTVLGVAELRAKYLAQAATTGNDSILGFYGVNDTLSGGFGNDTMRGNSGDDTYLHAQGDGQDYIPEWYYEGTDTLKLTGAAFTLANLKVANPNASDAVLSFSGVTDTITLQREFENNYGVEKIILNDGTVLGVAELKLKYLAGAGTTGNDNILGFNTNDTITGGLGNDTIKAYDGNDTITGGGGVDSLTGGSGGDNFVYTALTDSGKGAGARDMIDDFSHAQLDHIDLSAFAGTFSYLGSAAFTGGVNPEVRYMDDGTNTIVQVDANHDKTVDFEIQVNGHVALMNTDFVL